MSPKVWKVLAAGLVALTCAACSDPHPPTASEAPSPDYTQTCAPGVDSNLPCLEVTLQAIDHARATEGLEPLAVPADFASLSVPEQFLVAVDGERTARHLAPFVGLSPSLAVPAAEGAASDAAPGLPGRPFGDAASLWIGAVANGLDADFSWLYNDGPGSGVPDCGDQGGSGCWSDRKLLLSGGGDQVLGAAYAATADTTAGDQGGPSLAVIVAHAPAGTPLSYTWAQARADMARGTLRPRSSPPTDESLTGIPDPRTNDSPGPDYSQCASTGIDSSPRCIDADLVAINHARAAEHVRPMVLPPGFDRLTVPEQIFVAVNLERVDRDLPPFAGLTASLDADAAKGAATANDPPDPGSAYVIDDTEWAGGSPNGLDAVYGWMYDDGYDSGNLDCTRADASGCWGHRQGILDDFGTVGTLVMGAALDPTGDNNTGDVGGTSMAATLAVVDGPPPAFVFTGS